MNLKVEKQTMLKGVLLLALVANMSWGPTLKSLDFASEVATSEPTRPAEPATPARPANPPPNAVGPGQGGSNPDAPARVLEVSNEQPEVVPRICGARFIFKFKESKDPATSDLRTEISIRPHQGTANFQPIVLRGGLRLNFDDETMRKENVERATKVVRARFTNCPTTTTVGTNLRENDDDDRETRARRRSPEDIKKGAKECRNDRQGVVLSEAKRLRCMIDRISDIEAGDSQSSRLNAMMRLERLVNGDIRKGIKNRLLSKRDSDNEEGRELLEEAVAQLESIGGSLDLDDRRIEKLKTSLQSLAKGSEVHNRGRELSETVKARRDELREEVRNAEREAEMSRHDPVMFQIAARKLMMARNNLMIGDQALRRQLNMEMQNGPYRDLMMSMRMGAMSSSEFNQFTQPYSMINRDLLDMIRPQYGSGYNGMNMYDLGSLNMPSDTLNYRANLLRNGQQNVRNNGVLDRFAVPPSRPSVDSVFSNDSFNSQFQRAGRPGVRRQ